MPRSSWRFCVIEQVDIAVDLGAVPPPLPEIVTLRQSRLRRHRRKSSNKPWCLLDLALSVASGEPWWKGGAPSCRGLCQFRAALWAIAQRVNALCVARAKL
jgi:hypothetical protein